METVSFRIRAGDDPGRAGFTLRSLAADRLDVRLPPLVDGHAHPIALDQTTSFVGDGEGRLARIEPYTRDSKIAILTDGRELPISRSGHKRLNAILDENG